MDGARLPRIWLVSAATLGGAILVVTTKSGSVFWLGLGLVLGASAVGIATAVRIRRRKH
jgi:hypothetical protein